MDSTVEAYGSNPTDMESGLAFIGEGDGNPFEQFKEWFEEARANGHLWPEALTFSTTSQDGQPSSRSLLLRRLDDDGLVIVTDNRSKKSKELETNQKVAIVFLWIFMKDGHRVTKQVRLEGEAKLLNPDAYAEIYEREPLFCKLRSYVCHQGQPVNWQAQKETHDKLYEETQTRKNSLPMPDWFVGYKIYPTMFDFYYASGTNIGDRLCYLFDDNQWRHFRIAA